MFFNICFDTIWQQFTLMDCMVDRVESLHAFERGTSKRQKQMKLMLRWQSCSFYGTRCQSSLYETKETSVKRGTVQHPTKPHLRQHDLLSCTVMMKSFFRQLICCPESRTTKFLARQQTCCFKRYQTSKDKPDTRLGISASRIPMRQGSFFNECLQGPTRDIL
jgi:hypothetical protein